MGTLKPRFGIESNHCSRLEFLRLFNAKLDPWNSLKPQLKSQHLRPCEACAALRREHETIVLSMKYVDQVLPNGAAGKASAEDKAHLTSSDGAIDCQEEGSEVHGGELQEVFSGN